jgi:hypothetical protein
MAPRRNITLAKLEKLTQRAKGQTMIFDNPDPLKDFPISSRGDCQLVAKVAKQGLIYVSPETKTRIVARLREICAAPAPDDKTARIRRRAREAMATVEAAGWVTELQPLTGEIDSLPGGQVAGASIDSAPAHVAFCSAPEITSKPIPDRPAEIPHAD